MAEKNIKTRIIHKHDTEENWNKATNFIPKQGEIIVYDVDTTHSYERIKVGDGTTNVISLPYVGETVVDAELSATSENPVQNKIVKAALDKKQDIVQYTEMPEASEAYSNKIVQYIGETEGSYTRGYFYQCINIVSWDWIEISVSKDYNKMDKPSSTSSVPRLVTYSLTGGTGIAEINKNMLTGSYASDSIPTADAVKDYVEDNTSNPLKLSDTNLQKSGLLLQSYTPAGSTPGTVGTTTYSVIGRDVDNLSESGLAAYNIPTSKAVAQYVKNAVANKADISNPLSLSDTDITKPGVLIQHNYDGETPAGKYIARSIDTSNLSESLPASLNIPTSFAVAQYVKNAINSAITTALNTEV